MNNQTQREIAAWAAIIDELERRRLASIQNGGILSSVCQNTEDIPHGRNDRVRARVDRRAGEKGL